MPTVLGINGFGRIGRLVMRAAIENPQAQVVGTFLLSMLDMYFL
jgi:glyceraldehyde-3-phosphate dehydrogenase/erythrose-4-phosphate dehydrogenase